MSRTCSPPVQQLSGLFVGVNNRTVREPTITMAQSLFAALALGLLVVGTAMLCGVAS